MSRVKDVDTVAPDDQIVSTSVLLTHKTKKLKIKKKPILAEPSPNISDDVYKILGHAKSPLSSLLINPHVFNFPERDDDEQILIVARQHWFTNVRWILITILLLWVPSLTNYLPTMLDFPLNYRFVGFLFLYLAIFAYAFEQFLSWYFNVYIITTKRVIDIDFNNLLSKKYSEAGIEQVQDVTTAVIGAIPTVFNYGNILIQTASEVNELEFNRVPNPEKIIKVIQELRDHVKGGTL